MGIGMVAVVSADDVDRAMAILTARHVDSVILGTVEKAGDDAGGARVELTGVHPKF
jgi:phosphoribosylformylglycinamidine cyclo-ligase